MFSHNTSPAPLPFVTTKTQTPSETRLFNPLANVQCHNCKKLGHIMKDCKELKTTVAEMTGLEVMELFAADAAQQAKMSGNGNA